MNGNEASMLYQGKLCGVPSALLTTIYGCDVQ